MSRRGRPGTLVRLLALTVLGGLLAVAATGALLTLEALAR